MKECEKCGMRNPTSATTCKACGSSSLHYIADDHVTVQQAYDSMTANSTMTQMAPMAPMPGYYPMYEGYNPDKAVRYYSLGGFLKFIVVMNYIAAGINLLEGLIYAYQCYNLAVAFSPFVNADILIVYGLIYLGVCIVTAVVCFKLSGKIRWKDPDFLRFYQILCIISVALSLIIIFAYKKASSYFNASGLIVYLVIMIIAIFLYNLYFCCSERVYYYMGSNTYIKRSIITAGVTRWDAIEYDKRLKEGAEEKRSFEKSHSPVKVDPELLRKADQANADYEAKKIQSAVPASTTSAASAATVQPAPTAQPAPAKSPSLTIDDMEALKKLKELLDMGAISEEEYNNLRSKYISNDAENTTVSDSAGTSGSADSTVKDTSAPPQTLQAMEAGILGAAKKTTEKKQSWRCNDCSTVNAPDAKTCKYCGGVKLIVGYTAVTDEEAAAEEAKWAALTGTQTETQASTQNSTQPSTQSAQNSLASTPQPQVKFCGKCGSTLEPGARFCVACGNQVTY